MKLDTNFQLRGAPLVHLKLIGGYLSLRFDLHSNTMHDHHIAHNHASGALPPGLVNSSTGLVICKVPSQKHASSLICVASKHTHIHTHTQIYIYIYIYILTSTLLRLHVLGYFHSIL
jgi:hypothetical protein